MQKKWEKNQKQLSWRNPFTIFRARAASCVSSRTISREGWKRRIRETGIEKQKSKGWKREHCASRTSVCTLRDREVNISRAHTTLYLFSVMSTCRVRVRVFPISTDFTPKFSAGASLSPLVDLHNILEILYKISLLYLPILHCHRISSCTRYCWTFTAPNDRRCQMGEARRSWRSGTKKSL